jgi:hypothetical protein
MSMLSKSGVRGGDNTPKIQGRADCAPFPIDGAHGLAGYKASRSGASQLKQNLNISERVTELLAEREAVHSQATAKAIEATALTKMVP